MTRWHEDDLAGRLLNSRGTGAWTVLSLPALAEEGDRLGRVEGEPLWPKWYPLDILDERRRDLGERGFAALYQQRPAPAEGATFKRAWLDGRYQHVPSGARVVQAVDASFGKGVQSDFSAIVTAATDGQSYYVLHTTRGRWDFNTLCSVITREAERWSPEAVVVEDAAAGQSAIQELHRTTELPVVPVKPQGSKLARAEAVSPLFEADRVFFPAEQTRWRDELIEEMASFPGVRHDDQVDALVYALDRLRDRRRSAAGVAGIIVHRRHQRTQPCSTRLSEYEARRCFPGYRDPRCD
jgi:predicted phage terminase large subunit-like protein